MPQGSCWQAVLWIFPLLLSISPAWGLLGSAAKMLDGMVEVKELARGEGGVHAFSRRWTSCLYNYTRPKSLSQSTDSSELILRSSLLITLRPLVYVPSTTLTPTPAPPPVTLHSTCLGQTCFRVNNTWSCALENLRLIQHARLYFFSHY